MHILHRHNLLDWATMLRDRAPSNASRLDWRGILHVQSNVRLTSISAGGTGHMGGEQFPPRQKPAALNLGEVRQQMQESSGRANR